MPISLALDIIISVLLVLTIAYAVRLNQRLSQLRSDKNELLRLAKTFAEATTRAEAGIQNLKISSETLKAEVNKAAALKDDLAYLVERGGRSADEMVANVRAPKRAAGPVSGPGREPGREPGRGRDDAASMQGGPDARLIQDAIRAASTHNQETSRGAGEEYATREDRDVLTRRIAGHSARVGASSGASSGVPGATKTKGALATRGLNRGDQGRDMERDRAHMLDDDEAIEDTQAARELLKALGAVK